MNDKEDNRFIQSKKGIFNKQWLEILSASIGDDIRNENMNVFFGLNETEIYPECFFFTYEEVKDANNKITEYIIYINVFKDIKNLINEKKKFGYAYFQLLDNEDNNNNNFDNEDIPYYANLKFKDQDEFNESRIKLKWTDIKIKDDNPNPENEIHNYKPIFNEKKTKLYINPIYFKAFDKSHKCTSCDYVFKSLFDLPNNYIQKNCNNCGSNTNLDRQYIEIYEYLNKKLFLEHDTLICPNYKNIPGHKNINSYKNKDEFIYDIMEKKNNGYYSCRIPGCGINLNKNAGVIMANANEHINEKELLDTYKKKFEDNDCNDFVDYVEKKQITLKKQIELYSKALIYESFVSNSQIPDKNNIDLYKMVMFEVPKYEELIKKRDELLLKELYILGIILLFKKIMSKNAMTDRMNSFIIEFDKLFNNIEPNIIFEDLLKYKNNEKLITDTLYKYKNIVSDVFENKFVGIIVTSVDKHDNIYEPLVTFNEQLKRYPLIAFIELKSYIDKFNYIKLFDDAYGSFDKNKNTELIQICKNYSEKDDKNSLLFYHRLLLFSSVYGLNFKDEKEYFELSSEFNIITYVGLDEYNIFGTFDYETCLITGTISLYDVFNIAKRFYITLLVAQTKESTMLHVDFLFRFLYKTEKLLDDKEKIELKKELEDNFKIIKNNIVLNKDEKDLTNIHVNIKNKYSKKIFEWFIKELELENKDKFIEYHEIKNEKELNTFIAYIINFLTKFNFDKTKMDDIDTNNYDYSKIEEFRLEFIEIIKKFIYE
jgi:hypothetical protein